MGQQQNVQIDANTLEDVYCVACGGREFVPRVVLKYLPRILSPNGLPAIVTLADGVRCVACEAIISMADMQQMARDYSAQDTETSLVSPGGKPLPKAMLGMSEQKAPVIELTDVKKPEDNQG